MSNYHNIRPGKAGISWPVQELTSDPVTKFFQPGSKLTWHYNWNKNWDVVLPRTSKGLHINAEFMPMIFAPDYLQNEFHLQSGWTHLLGYNEPDHQDPSVAKHTTPQAAASAWAELAKLRNDATKKLVSPAVAVDKEWLKEFFRSIPAHSKPDYLAIHVYTSTFESFKQQVEDYWNTFHMPIFVTEFAMQSFDPHVPPPSSQQQVYDFMGQTTKWLDETSYIIKYAWFGACINAYNLHGVHPFNRLMDEAGNVTPLGHQYIAGGHD